MAAKCHRIATMLESKSIKSNLLLGGQTAIDYSASPSFLVSDNVTYGGSIPIKTYDDLELEDRQMLDDDRYSLCNCGTVYFSGYFTRSPCLGCGDGRMTRTLEPTTVLAFNGQIENAMQLFEAKCSRLDEEKRGTKLKRKLLG